MLLLTRFTSSAPPPAELVEAANKKMLEKLEKDIKQVGPTSEVQASAFDV